MRIKLKPIAEQTLVITGASSGIGLVTARRAAERGAKVILVARDTGTLEKIVKEIRERGNEADFIEADVGKREDLKRVVDTVVEKHGGFDTWVNNAGVGIYAPLEEVSDKDHHKVFQTNYWGVVYGSLEALKHLKKRGGALINLGSISSELPAPILSAYTASKFAVKGFTDSLRMELMHEKAPVSVTLIQPSGIHTPFGEHARNYMEARSQVPPPVYHPELVARAIVRSAESPLRSVMVGESGYLQTRLIRFFPRVGDKLFSRLFYKTALDWSQPNRNTDALHDPGEGGKDLGDQKGMIHKISPYTLAQMYPRRATVIALGAGAAIAAICLSRRHRKHHRRWHL